MIAHSEHIWNSGEKKAIPGHLYFSKNFKIILICIWILKNDYTFFCYIVVWVIPVQFSHSVVSDSSWPHGLQHARLPCLSTPGAYSNLCPLSRWCHPTISPSVIPFSCLQSCPASGFLPMGQWFTSGGQSIGASASASVLPMNIQDWFSLGLTGLISLWSKGFSRVFSNSSKASVLQCSAFFIVKLSHPYMKNHSFD